MCCICFDHITRRSPDTVRLRCRCLIHAECLVQYLRAQLGDASSSIGAAGVRCPYVTGRRGGGDLGDECQGDDPYIAMEDIEKFQVFLVGQGGSVEGVGGAATAAANATALAIVTTTTGAGAGGGVNAATGRGSSVTPPPLFGEAEVSKMQKFSVVATFNPNELVHCPTCNVPCWIDDNFRNMSLPSSSSAAAAAAASRANSCRVMCSNPQCGSTFCWQCQVPWAPHHRGKTCLEYQQSVSASDRISEDFVRATSKRCPSCNTHLTHFHGHSCHHISPVGAKGGGCPFCHVHFCYACLATGTENVELRGDRRACRCPGGRWSTYCQSDGIGQFLVLHPYPHDSRCGCAICPDCRPGKPCGGALTTADGGVITGDAGCDGTCIVCMGLVEPGPRELSPGGVVPDLLV